MSWGLTATLLFFLDARTGQWESVGALAGHCGVTFEKVRNELEPLAANGLVRVRRNHNSGEIDEAMCSEAEVTA